MERNDDMTIKLCCICGNLLDGYGNNPDGAVWKNADGTIELPTFTETARCCDMCNTRYVIPGRLYRMYNKSEKTSEEKK